MEKTSIDSNRLRICNTYVSHNKGPVIYWMSRDQRIYDNWALLYAQQYALKYKLPLIIYFCIRQEFLGALKNHYAFMLENILNLVVLSKQHNIQFVVQIGMVEDEFILFTKKINPSVVFCDFSPLKIAQKWKKSIALKIHCAIYEVDAHNIVPAWIASYKQEWSAYTFRKKINKLLHIYLTDYPKLIKHPFSNTEEHYKTSLRLIQKVKKNYIHSNNVYISGYETGMNIAYDFIKNKLLLYEKKHNNPLYNAQSQLSPYLHFGMISSQKIIRSFNSTQIRRGSSFFEQVVIRKELSDNYCLYNLTYDKFVGFPQWAQKTLQKHIKDKRDYIYSLDGFENAHTHDALWNASQMQLVNEGKMHGYLRMYWAKKILEWSKDPETAQNIAIYLNDKYSYDGRDPNGYTGIAWSIGGLHDRPWKERKIYGLIRYMSYKGCENKFNVEKFIKKYT